MPEKFLRSRAPVLCIFILIYAVLSVYVTLHFAANSHIVADFDQRETLHDLVRGTAYRPFVYRALVPYTAGLIHDATPESIRESINEWVVPLNKSLFFYEIVSVNPKLKQLFDAPELFYMRFVTALIVYLFLVGYIFLLYRLGTLLCPQSWAMALFMPVIGLLMIPHFYFYLFQLYDTAVLFFAAACYYCLARRAWPWYFFWFTVACFNKETTIFLMAFYLLWFYRRMDFLQYLYYAAIQIFIFVVIRTYLLQVFVNNPGDIFENHLGHQVAALLGQKTYNFRVLGGVLLAAFLLTFRWNEKPLFARYVLWLMPLMYVAHFIYGTPGEYRVFFDLFPLLTLLITDTLVEGTGIARAKLFHRPEYKPEG